LHQRRASDAHDDTEDRGDGMSITTLWAVFSALRGELLLAAASIACMVPARRAARIDPLESIRT